MGEGEEQVAALSKRELIRCVRLQQKELRELQQERTCLRQERTNLQRERSRLKKENEFLRALTDELREKIVRILGYLVLIKNKVFGKSSERSPRSNKDPSDKTPKAKGENSTKSQLPSERYPNAPLIEREVILQEPPQCQCCGEKMQDSGMTEDSEFLTTIPRQFFVVRQKRHKYRCPGCHGDIQTAPSPPRIKEGSSYSDAMMIDVAMTKYCDLVPIERYTAMAGREGLAGLPQQSLIEITHYLARFVIAAYEKLKAEILQSVVLHADETPHRMLEGDKKSTWFLWGFSNEKTSYFECHDTRSGDVASELLIPSKCQYLVSDVFSGYGKAVRQSNATREQHGESPILHVYCNAHSRRRFKDAKDRFPEEAKFFIQKYAQIYFLESQAKGQPPDTILDIRKQMLPLFDEMRAWVLTHSQSYSTKSAIGRAMSYFLGNYEELTRFIANPKLPIDNNPAERLLRNPVIGRKTWYGTHSKQGAQTAAVLFSLVESAKLNHLNPREYLKALVESLHQGKPPFTPREFKDLFPERP